MPQNSIYFSKFSWGGMPPDPLALACYTCLIVLHTITHNQWLAITSSVSRITLKMVAPGLVQGLMHAIVVGGYMNRTMYSENAWKCFKLLLGCFLEVITTGQLSEDLMYVLLYIFSYSCNLLTTNNYYDYIASVLVLTNPFGHNLISSFVLTILLGCRLIPVLVFTSYLNSLFSYSYVTRSAETIKIYLFILW